MADANDSQSNSMLQWDGDALQRKQYADYLTEFLVQKTQPPPETENKHGSYCLAIDASWGEGKSFFVDKWLTDIKTANNYPCFKFDAWESDINSDPLVAFMAALRRELNAYSAYEGAEPELTRKLEESVREGTKKLRKAIWPASKAILLGILNRYTSGAIGQVVDDYTHNDDAQEIDSRADKNGIRIGDSLDINFENLLSDEAQRSELITEFKQHIEKSIKLICEARCIKPPFFVFIDELDRCKPTFSIELLECLKHIFNVPGVCFVVSTNIEQLAHSIRAVYGSNFDGETYLRRFFDAVYTLPSTSTIHFIATRVAAKPSILSAKVFHGLPKDGFSNRKITNTKAESILWITESFGFDLRSQQQLIDMIDASLSGMKSDHTKHLLWLGALCAAYIKDKELFDMMITPPVNDAWMQKWRSNTKHGILRKSKGVSPRNIDLLDCMKTYITLCKHTAENFTSATGLDSIHDWDYPNSLTLELSLEALTLRNKQRFENLSIASYGHYVKCAGYFFSSEESK